MDQFEYKVVPLVFVALGSKKGQEKDIDTAETLLNSCGKEGWEAFFYNDRYIMFKRKIQ